MDKRLEIKIDQFDLTFQFNEQFQIMANEEMSHELEHRHFVDSVTFISALVERLQLENVFGQSQNRSGINFYNNVVAFGDYGNTSIMFGYSSSKREMGVMIHFTAQGLERYLSFRQKDNPNFTALDLAKEIQRICILSRGSLKFSRLDIACDFIGYGIKIDSVAKKILKQEYIAQKDRLSKNGSIGTYDIDLHLGEVSSSFNAIAGSDGFETIYLGNRSGKGNFLRIYNKYKDSFVKKKLTSDALNQTDWIRYELEIKFGQEGQFYFEQFCKLNSQEYEKWLASEVLSRFRIVTKLGRDTIITKELKRISDNQVNARASVVALEDKDLEQSKEHFKSGTSGFQSLLFKIRALEGEHGLREFIDSLIDYQYHEYEPTQAVNSWIENQSVSNKLPEIVFEDLK